MDPVTIVTLWMVIKPIRLIRNRLRAKRGLPPLTDAEVAMPDQVVVTMPDGTQTTRTEPIIPGRTSTKVAVGSGVVAAFPAVELLTWIQSLQLEPAWLESATNSPYFIYYGSLLIAYVIARFTKSPIAPQSV